MYALQYLVVGAFFFLMYPIRISPSVSRGLEIMFGPLREESIIPELTGVTVQAYCQVEQCGPVPDLNVFPAFQGVERFFREIE